MSCCGNCEACRPRQIGCSSVSIGAHMDSVIVLYAASEEDILKIAEENPGKTILVRQWGSDEEYQGKSEAMAQYIEEMKLKQEAFEKEDKRQRQIAGRDQWKHRQKFHSR